jgi:hypothetical protein
MAAFGIPVIGCFIFLQNMPIVIPQATPTEILRDTFTTLLRTDPMEDPKKNGGPEQFWPMGLGIFLLYLNMVGGSRTVEDKHVTQA